MEAGIAVPELYGVIGNQHDVRQLGGIVGERRDFVIKPAHGTGGDGILVVDGRSAAAGSICISLPTASSFRIPKSAITRPISSAGNTVSSAPATAR